MLRQQPLHPKIQIVTNALRKITKSAKYAIESNAIIFVAIDTLEALPPQGDKELNLEIAEYLMGALIAALATHQLKYSKMDPMLAVISSDPNHEFCNRSFSQVSYEDLTVGIPLKDGKLDTLSLIEQTGRKVLAKIIPFEQKKLTFLFPDLKDHFEAVKQIIECKKDADMPSVAKTTYSKSLDEIKQKISEFFTPYYANNKFHFFGYGPHHKTRARQVLAAVQAATDVDTIVEILENQQHVMQGISNVEVAVKLKNSVGLDPRWTTSANLKNKAKSLNQSGYYDILTDSTNFITACVSNKEDLYKAVMSPHIR